MQDGKLQENMVYAALTSNILSSSFEVMRELGTGFQERVYKNALMIAMRQKGLFVETEKTFEVIFRGHVIGKYSADLVVENVVIVELKCCEKLIGEHQAQLINYLAVARLPIGLLINFKRRRLEYKRLHWKYGCDHIEVDETKEIVPF